MNLYLSFGGLVSAVVFRYLGASAVAAFREEIVDKQNMALALLVGLVSVGASIIIAAAVH